MSGRSEHHLGLDVRQCLHAGHGGRGEGGPRLGGLRMRLGRPWGVLQVLT